MRTLARVKGLQDVLNDESAPGRTRMSVLNRLSKLQREKDRISQERSNWQEKVDAIDARLAQIAELQNKLQPLLADAETPCKELHQPEHAAATAEAPADELTVLRY
jgi:uncharacterized protein (DUF3084 family)